jgi:dTDP-4-dehydrorhamnose 3,5-epimerase
MLIPAGFLHGFCTLEDNTVVLYKMSSLYAPGSECGTLWNDPDLNIEWPVSAEDAILSGKDEKLPRFKELPRIAW